MPVGTAAGTYEYLASSVVGTRDRIGVAAGTYGWGGDATGESHKGGTAFGGYGWQLRSAVGDNGENLPDDRFRLIVQETRTGQITSRDLGYTNLQLQRALSGPCSIACDINPNDTSAQGIYFKPWEQYIHVEVTRQGKRRIWCSGIVQPSDVDEKTGVLHLKAQGFAGYPKGLPWLENIDWYVNDCFDPVTEIWSYLQSYPNGQLNVEVFPTKSGIYMLPGYSYDGSTMSLNFFATFVRATDKLDCGDYIDAMARDVPFDYAERQQWNADRTDIIKKIELGAPRLGDIQSNLAFVINENVISAKPHTESQIDWVSDIGITGWFPGVEYCCPDDTEILTQQGFKRYDELVIGDQALTLNNDTGLAEWQPVEAVNVFEGERWLYETSFRGHSSATTAEHRWPVSWRTHAGMRDGGRRWSTTATLTKNEKISCAAPVVDLPSAPKYDDALVELMAWYWTEGTHTAPGGNVTISQWGAHMARIRAAATKLFGPELVGYRRDGTWRGAVWKTNGAGNVIRFGTAASAVILEDIVDYRTKAVSYDFIANLTQAQLELFINCSVWADADSDWRPTDRVTFGQKYEQGVDLLQFACQLAGRKSVKHVDRTMNGQPWYSLGIYAQHRTQIKAASLLDNMQRRWHTGVVWCPTTANGTWCARRNGTVYFTGNSYELANADPARLRRYLKEADANLNSNERSQAWANRLLARRQTPAYWETITIDMGHPNAPFGTFDVGDTITVSGSMPWVGFIEQDHKIMAISVDDTKNACQLSLKADGAFNYNPIFFPDSSTNIVDNPGFDFNLEHWTASGPGWTWDGSQGAAALGSVTVIADGTDQDLYTIAYGIGADFTVLPLSVKVKAVGAVTVGNVDSIQLVAQFYDDDLTPTQAFEIDGLTGPNGFVPWTALSEKVITPAGSTHVALRLHVGAALTAGQVWFDDAGMII